MRIALVLDRFDPDRGGLEGWAWQWICWLLERGHHVEVVAGESRPDLVRERLAVHVLGCTAGRFDFAARVADVLPRVDCDLVHDLGVGWRCDILQPQFGTRLADDRRALASMPIDRRIGAWLSPNRRRRLADIMRLERRQYAPGGPHVVAVSRMTRDDLVAAHGLPADRVTIIHNGVDVTRFAPASVAARAAARQALGLDDAFVLLFAGHNFRLKGLDTVMRAVARLRHPTVRLLVTGRGPIAASTRRARRLGIAPQVTFAGFVSDVRLAYAAADAFVQPTFYDPCSLTALEAAACGLPVLTSRFNGAAELFKDGESAWILADPADHAAAARGIAAWLDPATRHRMGAAARRVAESASHHHGFTRLFDLCCRTLRARRVA